MPVRSAWRRIRGTRAGVICLLCAATVALLLSDFRYETLRSGLLPGVVTGQWGVSPRGVAMVNADPSVVILSALDGPQFSYLVNHVPAPGRFAKVRVSVEMATRSLTPGPQAWERARILLWSYDGAGQRLRYLPHELGALDGTSDWRRMTLVLPVLPEVRMLRLIIYNGGLEGRMLVRNITVDAVADTRLFRALRAALIGLWIAAAGWALLPLLAFARRRPSGWLAMAAGAAVLAGTLLPQPMLSSLVAPVERVAQRLASPPPQAVVGTVPDSEALRRGVSPGGEPPGTGPDEARQVDGLRIVLTPGWAPWLEAGVAAHLVAFVVLGALFALVFPGGGPVATFLYLAVFAVASETLQGFHYSRTPELRDLMANLAGIPLGIGLAHLMRCRAMPWRAG